MRGWTRRSTGRRRCITCGEGPRPATRGWKNPAPQRLRSSIDLRLSGTGCAIEFEHTRRGCTNDIRFGLQRDGQTLGLIHEPEALTTRRRLSAGLPPDMRPEVQGFLLFLVINLALG